jgi:hypothetical protein
VSPVRSWRAGGAVGAGIAYFIIVFAAGFVLGTVRTLLVVPLIGALGAVLLEIPFMLAIAWAACRWLIARFAVVAAWPERLLMGVLAFALLLAGELMLFVFAFGGSPRDFVSAYATPPGAVGVAAQVVFAAMPLFIRRASSRPDARK